MERYIDSHPLKRLNLDYIDCLAIHGEILGTFGDCARSTGCMEAVRRALADGRIRHIGDSRASGSILAAINTGCLEFVNHCIVLFFQRNAAIELAKHKRYGRFFIISPADKGGQLYAPETLAQIVPPFSYL